MNVVCLRKGCHLKICSRVEYTMISNTFQSCSVPKICQKKLHDRGMHVPLICMYLNDIVTLNCISQ